MNVIATPGAEQVSLSWDASPGATSYTIYRSTTSGSEGNSGIYQIGVTSTSCTDTGLTNAATYFFTRKNRADTASGDRDNSRLPPQSVAMNCLAELESLLLHALIRAVLV